MRAKEDDINLDSLKCLHCTPLRIDGVEPNTEELKAAPCYDCEDNTSIEMSAVLTCSHRLCKTCVEALLTTGIATGRQVSCKCGVDVDTETVFTLSPELCARYMERAIL